MQAFRRGLLLLPGAGGGGVVGDGSRVQVLATPLRAIGGAASHPLHPNWHQQQQQQQQQLHELQLHQGLGPKDWGGPSGLLAARYFSESSGSGGGGSKGEGVTRFWK